MKVAYVFFVDVQKVEPGWCCVYLLCRCLLDQTVPLSLSHAPSKRLACVGAVPYLTPRCRKADPWRFAIEIVEITDHA